MRLSREQKSLKRTVMAIFALILCAFSFILFPVNFATATSEEVYSDRDAFNSALVDILNEYDYTESQETAISALADGEKEEKTVEINRLIVNSNDLLNSKGAIAKAEYRKWHIFQYADAESTQNAYEYYSNLASVNSVSYDYVTTATEDGGIETDTAYTYKSWGASYLGYSDYVSTMLELHSQEDLPEIIIAVLDSGIYTSHELFKNRILHAYAQDYTGEDTSTYKYEYEDLNGHGTHVAGTIAEATLSNVKILPLKVLKSNGKGTVSMIVSALEDLVDYKKINGLNIKAVNMSIGVDSSSSTPGGVSANNNTLNNTVINVYNAGIMPVVAAGNDHEDTSNASPANVPQAITVSALVRTYPFPYGETLVFDSSYSNYGSHVDFCAPGTSIKSAGLGAANNYVSMSGTSMAAPHVTACVALLYSNPTYKDYTLSQMETLMKDNTVDYGIEGWDKEYGYGLINLAEVGVENVGYVNFSNENQYPTGSFKLKLTYDAGDDNLTTKIYYSTDENVSVVDSSANLYTTELTISKTTKVTAIALVYNSSGNLVKRSYNKSITYYFNNSDLISNYEYVLYANGAVITKYNGELSTLNVPTLIKSLNVVGIDEFAFKNTSVEILNLPSTVYLIYDYAFYGNTNLKEIHCENKNIRIGNYAFRDCSNLGVLDFGDITTVGQYAFASCTSLKSLSLPNATTIGLHAFTKSGLKTVLFGNSISSIGNQTNLSLTQVYGYAGTVAESFAEKNDISFYDLTLQITQNFNNRIIVKDNQSFNLYFAYQGYQTTETVTGTAKNYASVTKSSIDEYQDILSFGFSNLSAGEYTLYVRVTDGNSKQVQSNTIYIEVVSNSTKTFSINYETGDFEVYVDEQLITPSTLFYQNFEYSIKIVAKDGYNLKNISINGENKAINETYYLTPKADLNIEVETSVKSSLIVTFNTADNGKIYVGGNVVTSTTVARNQDIAFAVVANEGYALRKVAVDGQLLLVGEDGLYHLENVVADIVVNIPFVESYYKIEVSLGKGGNLSTAGGDIDSVAHGSSRTFVISPSQGYEVDFVSVNGKIIQLNGNTFTLENIDEDYDIIVSFKEESKSLFSDSNSVVLTYFILFLVIFGVFVLAKIVLTAIRKKQK